MTDMQKELLDAIEEIALEKNMTIEEVTKQAIELLEQVDASIAEIISEGKFYDENDKFKPIIHTNGYIEITGKLIED